MGSQWSSSTVTPGHRSESSGVTEFRFDPDSLPRLPARSDVRWGHCFPYPFPTDQGTEGSCVLHAATAAYLCAQRRTNVSVVDTDVPYISDLFMTAKRYPSDRSRSAVEGSNGVTFSEAMRALSERAEWYRLQRDVANFRRSIAAGFPVVFGFALSRGMMRWQDTESWIQQTNCIIPLPAASDKWEPVGYHCVVLVGYDDELHGGVFIVRNSWGKKWGCNGHFYLPYEALSSERVIAIAIDAMVLDVAQTRK